MAYKDFYEQLMEEQTSIAIQDNDDHIRDAFLDDPESDIMMIDDSKVKELIDKIPVEDIAECKEAATKTNDELDDMYNPDDLYLNPFDPVSEEFDFDFDLEESVEEEVEELDEAAKEAPIADKTAHGKDEDEDYEDDKLNEDFDIDLMEDFDFSLENFDDELMDLDESTDDTVLEAKDDDEELEDEEDDDATLESFDFDDDFMFEGDLADVYADDEDIIKYGVGSEDKKGYDQALKGDLNKDHLEDVYNDKSEDLVK